MAECFRLSFSDPSDRGWDVSQNFKIFFDFIIILFNSKVMRYRTRGNVIIVVTRPRVGPGGRPIVGAGGGGAGNGGVRRNGGGGGAGGGPGGKPGGKGGNGGGGGAGGGGGDAGGAGGASGNDSGGGTSSGGAASHPPGLKETIYTIAESCRKLSFL